MIGSTFLESPSTIAVLFEILLQCVCGDKNFKTILRDIMSSLFLLRLPWNLPVLVPIRSVIYFRFVDLCPLVFYACSGFQFMLMIKEEKKIESREEEERKRKDFFNVTGFPSFHN